MVNLLSLTQSTQTDRKPQSTASVAPLRFTANPPNMPRDEDYSIWRHTALRYGGYADEFGEFLSPYLGSFGKFIGYSLAGLYTVGDLATTLPAKFKNASAELNTVQKLQKTSMEAADLSVFHLFATLLVPPKLIGLCVEAADRFLDGEQLAHERAELANKKGLAHRWGQFHLNLETRLHQQWGDPLAQWILKKLDPENGHLDQLKGKLDDWIDQRGNGLGGLLQGTAVLAKGWDKIMPWSYFKDPKLYPTLMATGQDLKNGAFKQTLTPKKLAKLIGLKPWPVLLGVGMVPFIAHPFDRLMVTVENWSIRLLTGKNRLVRDAQGKLQSVRDPQFWGLYPKHRYPHLYQQGQPKASSLNSRSTPDSLRFRPEETIPPHRPWGWQARYQGKPPAISHSLPPTSNPWAAL